MKKTALVVSIVGLTGLFFSPAYASPIVGTGLPGPAGSAETHWTAQVGTTSTIPLPGPLLGLTVVNGALDYPGAWVAPERDDCTMDHPLCRRRWKHIRC